MLAGATIGSDVVMLDAAVASLGLASQERGLQLNWIVEAAGASSPVGPFSFAGGMRAETPLSPVHIRAERMAGGVQLRWVRRGRIDADGWDASDIPLDETEEGYRIEVLDGETLRRTSDVTAPFWLYPASDELIDFGSAQSTLSVRISQLGRSVPLGIAARAILHL